ncbi:MAG TPA: tetratricopeptide repeat protein [Nitrospira sp.]|nr:tetratricopeptide repeat protein [Nitrospira sp.]
MRMLTTIVFFGSLAVACSSQSGQVQHVLSAPNGTKPAAATQLEKGNGLFTSRDYAGAEQAFREAIVVDPTFAEAHYNLALTLDRTGHKDEARKHYIEAANLAPGNKVIWDSPPLRQQAGGLDHNIGKKSYLDPNPRGF